jgi:hypothetical protein
MKRLIFIVLAASVFCLSGLSQKVPEIDDLKQVSQVPSEIPQRITGMAFDGEKLWFSVYLSKGHYATYNPKNQEWQYSNDNHHHKLIREISEPFGSTSGITFADKTLWFGGSYGESFGSINTETWKIEKHFAQEVKPNVPGSQSYSSFAYDGVNLWVAWHWLSYKLPDSETQQLLKIDTETGKILEKFPLPAGSKPDMVHGLTFDGEHLWHIKDKKLSKLDRNGVLTAQFILQEMYRPSGLAWDGESLWIVEFSGKLWKIPFKKLEYTKSF